MDLLAIAVLVLATCASMLMVPDIHMADLGEPTVLAAVGTPFVLAAIVALRLAGAPVVHERRLLALFLIFMPGVYLTSLAFHGGGAPWPAVEVAGLVIFAALAFAGLRGSAWFLVAGIGGHGLLWDLWHHGRTGFIADWYTVGCLIVDVGYAFYAANRVAAWHAEAERTASVGRVRIPSPMSPLPTA